MGAEARVIGANPLKPALAGLVRLEAYATTFRYGTSSGKIKATMPVEEEDAMVVAVRTALHAAVAAFDVDLAANPPVAKRPAPARGA